MEDISRYEINKKLDIVVDKLDKFIDGMSEFNKQMAQTLGVINDWFTDDKRQHDERLEKLHGKQLMT